MELLRRKNVAASFDAPLIDASNWPYHKSSATLAAGDVKISKDGASPVNIGALPVEIGATGVYRFSLTAPEMNAATVSVICIDAAGNQWYPLVVTIYTSAADEVHLSKAALVNKREHTVASGADVIKDDDGTTTLRTLSPSESNGVITVTPG